MFPRRRTRLSLGQPRRIGVIKPSALGDIVHAMPTLAGLRRLFPDARIDWVASRSLLPLVECHPLIDHVIPFDRKALKSPSGAMRFASELRARQWDVAIDLQGLFRSGLISWASRAPRRVGLSTAREGSRWFLTDIIPVEPERVHAVDRLRALLVALGDEPSRPIDASEMPNPEAAFDDALRRLENYPRPWLVVSPGSRWQTKRWRLSHFAEILRRIQDRHGGTAIIVGSPDEKPLAQELAASIFGPVLAMTGETSLAGLMSLVRLADFVMANDSGPLHLAALMGKPLAAPYTCTRIDRHGPHAMFGQAVATTVACAGSYLRTCDSMICMDELTPDRLWPAVERALTAWPTLSISHSA